MLPHQFECLLQRGEIGRQRSRRSLDRRGGARYGRTRDVVPLTVAQSCVPLRVLRAVFVMPCFSRFAPVHLRMLQVSRHVVVTRSGPRLTCAERADRRSEQPYQRSPTGLRQPSPNGAARRLTATTCGNSALSSYCPPNANGLGPPPTLTTIRVRQFRHCSGALLVTLCSQHQISDAILVHSDAVFVHTAGSLLKDQVGENRARWMRPGFVQGIVAQT